MKLIKTKNMYLELGRECCMFSIWLFNNKWYFKIELVNILDM